MSGARVAGGNAVARALAGSPLIAVTLYVAIAGALLLMTGLSVAEILSHRQALAQTSDLLDQFRGRKGAAKTTASAMAEHPGTPFLEGPTVTVAGANLLQRVAAAVNDVGGLVQSSQVDVSGAQSKDGFVGLVVSCEPRAARAPEAALRSRGRHAVPVRGSARRPGAADHRAERRRLRPRQGDPGRLGAMAGGEVALFCQLTRNT